MKINTGLILKLQSGGITVSQGVGYEAPKKRMLTPDMMEDVGVKSPEIDLKPLDDIKSEGYHTAAFEQHVGSKVRAIKSYAAGMDKWDRLFEGPQIAREIASLTNPTTFLDMKHQEERTKRGLDLMKENGSETLPAVVGDETWVKDVKTGEVKKVDMGEYMSRKGTDLKQLNWNEFNMYWDAVGSRDLRATDNVNMGWNYGGEKIASKIAEFAKTAGKDSYSAVAESIERDPTIGDAYLKNSRGLLDKDGLKKYENDFKKIDAAIQGLLAFDPTLYNSLMAQSANKVNPLDDKGKPKTMQQLRKEQHDITKEDLLSYAFGVSSTLKESSSTLDFQGGINDYVYGKKGGSGTDDEKISFWTVATHPTNDISQLVDSFPSTIGDGLLPIRKIGVPSNEMKPLVDMASKPPVTVGTGKDAVTVDKKTAYELSQASRGSMLLTNGKLLDQKWMAQNGGKFLMDNPTGSITHLPENPEDIERYLTGLKKAQEEAKALASGNAVKSGDKDVDMDRLKEYAQSQATDQYEKSWKGPLMVYATFNMVGQASAIKALDDKNTIMKEGGKKPYPIIDEMGFEELEMIKGEPQNSLGIRDNKSTYMKDQLNTISDESFSYTYKVPVYVPVPNSFWHGDNAKNEYDRQLRAEMSQNSQRVEELRRFSKYTGLGSSEYTTPK